MQKCDYEYMKINLRLEQAGKVKRSMDLEALFKWTEKSYVFHICHKAIRGYEERKKKNFQEDFEQTSMQQKI